MSAKQAINDKLQGSIAIYLRSGGVVNNQNKKGLLLVVTFFNHNFVNCKSTCTLIWRLKIYEIKYNISLNDVHT